MLNQSIVVLFLLLCNCFSVTFKGTLNCQVKDIVYYILSCVHWCKLLCLFCVYPFLCMLFYVQCAYVYLVVFVVCFVLYSISFSTLILLVGSFDL